jgi:hypothetical protein
MRFEAIQQVSNVFTRPAPVKGINAYDAIIAMPEGFALILRNLFAQPYGVQVRHGYVRHAVGLEGDVETLMSHNTTVPKLYAFSSAPAENRATLQGIMYDVTTANAPPFEVGFGYANARWQHINFPNEAGVHLLAVNGADSMIWIAPDGTLTDIMAGDGTTNTISGVDPAKCIHIYSHQKRVWLTEKDTTSGWYLPPNVLFGVAKQFDFGPNWTRGGYLMQIITWTIDDGNGADDHLVAISSEGEVSVYQGIDPDGADTWALQGVYYAGAPVGRRAACRYGGDIAIITQFGLVMLSDLLKSTKVNPTDEGSGRYIQQLVSAAVTATGDLFGWQPFVYPGDNQFYINVPTTPELSYQFVMNDITKAWSEFIGYQAHCWELHQQRPFFGGFGGVYRAWEGFTDDAIIADDGVVTLGAAIRSEAQTAYTNFGKQVINKHYKMVRPSLLSTGRFNVSVACNVDYSFQSALSPVAFDSYQPGRWDEDYWDTARWAGGLMAFNEWITVLGIGFVASLRILITSTSETYWASSDWVYEDGGVM